MKEVLEHGGVGADLAGEGVEVGDPAGVGDAVVGVAVAGAYASPRGSAAGRDAAVSAIAANTSPAIALRPMTYRTS